ncbi:MAG: Alanyl-tRNA synthetase (EC [uncultured Campylobacterales bacterium]|uniref:Alanine--tRNA ligase n=1 Tax=uncultured Campylobacterales bacterium TaxID=352960 RepID=A0A6S6TCU5_9BACT|nr:MAG: Alanyl-tRNA synthetase (EC [uncultured Campylobacterales bacterium]
MNIRAEFLEYFKNKDHKIYPSAPIVPNDASLLFTNAGMVPFKDIFTGNIPVPNPPRGTSAQTCLRAGGKHNDLENVGFTSRHHTLFEMLGNFSFGDYFKEKAIANAWDFITNVLKLPVDKLWVTIHNSDDEAYDIWKNYIAEDRIKRLGDKDNFWQMGDTGPCGPCSEIFYDQGSTQFNSDEDYLGGDGDRFLEIWNLVFMQYEKQKNGELKPLPNPSIDTGMGYERVVAIKEGVQSNYSSSLFMPIINEIQKISNTKYEYEKGASFRVIADHIRSISFLLAQGITFDKIGRGYVLRRILRRAVRHGYKLGIKKPFLYQLVDVLESIMGENYSYLGEKKEFIKNQIKTEEIRFFETIEDGIKLFNNELNTSKDLFDGKVAFKLYDTYGFPIDLTADMLKESNLTLDIDTYNQEMQKQKERSKQNSKFEADIDSKIFKKILEKTGTNEFIGYNETQSDAKILYLLDDSLNLVEVLKNGTGYIVFDKSIFYPTSGGQIGDEGILSSNGNVIASILNTEKKLGIITSKVKVLKEIKTNEVVLCEVDTKRNETSKHHSATHLLHKVLQEVLGDNIRQAGSLVTHEYLRFDFTHNEAIDKNTLEKIEELVNTQIQISTKTLTKISNIEDAKKFGAMALFGEKYDDEVRVVSIGQNSIELCGGTHVSNTSEIGMFLITKESGVSAGVRRIEALCGKNAYNYVKEIQNDVQSNLVLLKAQTLNTGIQKLQNQVKTLKTEIKELNKNESKELNVQVVNGYNVIVELINNGDIKDIIDTYKNKFENLAILLLQKKGDKVMLVAGNKNTSLKAGLWIKSIAPIVAGGGGGRDDFAQAGGKDTTKIDKALKEAFAFAKNTLEGN